MTRFTLRSALLIASMPVLFAACGGSTDETPALATETGGGTIQGFVDYSYDKNSILLSTGTNSQTVFLDSIYPFDTTLRYNNAEPLVKYQLDHKPLLAGGNLMVAVADLRKLYAPYLSYSVNTTAQAFTITHQLYKRRVTAGSGSRAPTVEFTKVAYTGTFSLGSTTATASSVVYATTTNSSALDTAPIATTTPPTIVSLSAAPMAADGLVYVSLDALSKTLGKTITDDTANSGYLAVSDVDPSDKTADLFNPAYTGKYSYAPITSSRVAYMNGVLGGTIAKGNFWNAFYMGDITEFTGTYDANGNDVTDTKSVDRVIPYRVYVPKNYDATRPSKFTFLLHGATGNENAQIERANDHLKNQPSTVPNAVTVEDLADYYNYLLLLPNGWTRNPLWGKGPGEQSLQTAFAAMKQVYNVDPARTFIAGNSLGGAGTMNFAIRHPSLFKAMAPVAPAPGKPLAADIKGAVLDLPTLLACNTADTTVYYAGTSSTACQPWYQANVKNVLHNVTFVTVENGHHSYGFASLYPMTFEFFDRVLDSTAKKDVATVAFTAGSTSATVTTSGGSTSTTTLGAAPVNQGGTVMVSLNDLANIYGAADFRINDVNAYNLTPADLVAVKTIKYNNVALNIKVGTAFLRVGGTVHAGDTTGPTAVVQAGDASIDLRSLSVAPYSSNGQVYVPVVEFMALLGKTVSAN